MFFIPINSFMNAFVETKKTPTIEILTNKILAKVSFSVNILQIKYNILFLKTISVSVNIILQISLTDVYRSSAKH